VQSTEKFLQKNAFTIWKDLLIDQDLELLEYLDGLYLKFKKSAYTGR
jgi:hypothetical protein